MVSWKEISNNPTLVVLFSCFLQIVIALVAYVACGNIDYNGSKDKFSSQRCGPRTTSFVAILPTLISVMAVSWLAVLLFSTQK